MILEFVSLAQGIVERGLIFGLIVAAVYIASRLIHFDNLAIEGAFGLGGAITALLLSHNLNAWFSLGIAIVLGALSGVVTALLTTKLKLNNLISGIVVTTGLFSIALKIAGSNMTFARTSTVFSYLSALGSYQTLLMLIVICCVTIRLIQWLLVTEVGYVLHAAGSTPQMVTNIGKSVDRYIMLGLSISNALAALGGALFVQYTGYFSIWASVGVLIIGLAGMILSHVLSDRFELALIVGSCIYQAIIALTFELQMDQDWNKLVTALLIIVLIALKQRFDKK